MLCSPERGLLLGQTMLLGHQVLDEMFVASKAMFLDAFGAELNVAQVFLVACAFRVGSGPGHP